MRFEVNRLKYISLRPNHSSYSARWRTVERVLVKLNTLQLSVRLLHSLNLQPHVLVYHIPILHTEYLILGNGRLRYFKL